MKNIKWVKTPKHILRELALKSSVKNYRPGRFLEFGAGTGDFTKYFLESGYNGYVHDINKITLQILKDKFKGFANVIVIDDYEDLEIESFDYLLAFEVLEHIPEDVSALRKWSKYLKKGGRLVISVPAHQKKFSMEDHRVGHVRRYEKVSLYKILKATGYEDINMINYGYPVGNITRQCKNLINWLRRNSKKNEKSQLEKSIESGIRRDEVENKLSFLFSSKFLMPFYNMQEWFFNRDIGDGYVVTARKKT